MKNLLFLIFITFYLNVYSSSRTINTKYKFIKPLRLENVYCPGDLYLTVRVINYGPDNLTSNDSLQTYIYRKINLTTPYYDKFNVKLNKNVPVNDSIEFIFKIRLWDTVSKIHFDVSNSGGYFFYNSLNPILSDPGKSNNEKYAYVTLNLIYDRSVNTNNIKNFNFIKIYPNPFIDYLEISNSENKISQVEFYDIYGKLVLSKGDFKENDNIIIETNELISGIYFVKVIAENSLVFTQKVIKN